MKVRLIKVLCWLVVLFGLSKGIILASGFNIKSIGSVNTNGQQLSHWWYTDSNPTFSGEAPANSEVLISIDDTETVITADANNNWHYTSGSLNEGDHKIVIRNNDSVINFTLTIGLDNVNWSAVEKGSNETLPTVGVVFPTLVLSLSGLGFVFGARKIAGKK